MILEKGDRVALIGPASSMRATDRGLVDAAHELLLSWGLRPTVTIEAERHFYLAGNDDFRSSSLNTALGDPEVRAIFCTRGGYGSQRLLTQVSFDSMRGDKVLVGFSDITALHLAAIASGQESGPTIRTIHGPNLATKQLLDRSPDAAANRSDLRRALFDESPIEQAVTYLRPGQARGPLIGGCLSLVASQIGTPYFPSLDGAVVFLEDVGESPYRIDRMLFQLRNAELIARSAAFVFGVMHDCQDGYNRLEDVIVDILGPYDVPIAIGLASGHGLRNAAIPLGTPATVDSATGTVVIDHWSSVDPAARGGAAD